MNTVEDKISNIYKEYKPRLYAFAKKIVKNDDSAKDCVQEVFKRLVKQDLNKLEDHLHQWLFVVCRNCSLKQLKKQNFYAIYEEEDESFSEERNPHESLDHNERIEKMLSIIKQLPEKKQKLLKLRFYSDLKYEQIAKKMKTTSGNIGFQLSTTLKDLRSSLLKEIDRH